MLDRRCVLWDVHELVEFDAEEDQQAKRCECQNELRVVAHAVSGHKGFDEANDYSTEYLDGEEESDGPRE